MEKRGRREDSGEEKGDGQALMLRVYTRASRHGRRTIAKPTDAGLDDLFKPLHAERDDHTEHVSIDPDELVVGRCPGERDEGLDERAM